MRAFARAKPNVTTVGFADWWLFDGLTLVFGLSSPRYRRARKIRRECSLLVNSSCKGGPCEWVFVDRVLCGSCYGNNKRKIPQTPHIKSDVFPIRLSSLRLVRGSEEKKET